MGIELPPVIAAGDPELDIRANPQVGEPMARRAGLIYTVTIADRAFGRAGVTWILIFAAKYINEDRWEVEIIDN